MPKTFTELWLEYTTATNPVTKWALRECVQVRIDMHEMHIAQFYLYNLSRDE